MCPLSHGAPTSPRITLFGMEGLKLMQTPVGGFVNGPSEMHSRDHQTALSHLNQVGREHGCHPQRGKYRVFIPTGIFPRLLLTLGLLDKVIGGNPHFCLLQPDRSHRYPRPTHAILSCMTWVHEAAQPVSLVLAHPKTSRPAPPKQRHQPQAHTCRSQYTSPTIW